MSRWSAAEQPVDPESLVGLGLYSISETAAILTQALKRQIRPTNLRRWSFGRTEIVREYAPIIHVEQLRLGTTYLFTFSELIELFTIAALRASGVTLPTVRYAYNRATEKYGPHPFARRQFSRYGRDGVFATPASLGVDMEELSTGRLAFEQIVVPLLENVSYLEDNAASYSPLGLDRSVVLDPERSFGSAINRDSGVRTAILFNMHKTGESIERVAQWYRISGEAVQDAIDYETSLRAA